MVESLNQRLFYTRGPVSDSTAPPKLAHLSQPDTPCSGQSRERTRYMYSILFCIQSLLENKHNYDNHQGAQFVWSDNITCIHLIRDFE